MERVTFQDERLVVLQITKYDFQAPLGILVKHLRTPPRRVTTLLPWWRRGGPGGGGPRAAPVRPRARRHRGDASFEPSRSFHELQPEQAHPRLGADAVGPRGQLRGVDDGQAEGLPHALAARRG